MIGIEPFAGARAVLAERNFRLFAIGHAIAYVGFWVNFVAVGWLTWQLTGSPTWLGIVGFADLFPALVIGPFAAALIDRWDRRRVLMVTVLSVVAQMSTLFVLVFAEFITIEGFLVLVLFQGVIIAFSQPATPALIAHLVRKENLPAAMAVDASIAQVTNFMGPVVAGFILVLGDIAFAFLFNAICYFSYFVSIFLIRMEATKHAWRVRDSVLSEVREGLRYAVAHRGIGPILLLLLIEGMIARPVSQLLPGFAAEVFGRGAEGVATLNAAIGLGALVAALWLAHRGRIAGLTALTLGSFVLLGGAMLAFGAATAFPAGVAAMVVFGAATSALVVGSQTLTQCAVDDAVRGRIMGAVFLISRGGAAFGTLIMGRLADTFGLQAPVLGGALILGIFWLWTMNRRRAITAAFETGSD